MYFCRLLFLFIAITNYAIATNYAYVRTDSHECLQFLFPFVAAISYLSFLPMTHNDKAEVIKRLYLYR